MGYFKEKPNDLIFIKASLGGGAGTSVPWCDTSAGRNKAAPMYMLKNDPNPKTLESNVATCARQLARFVYDFKNEAEAKKKEKWANPATTYGYPGIVLEPGYDFQVEVKCHVVWGKLFAIASETPSKCLHFSNGHNGSFIQFRGFEGDGRPTNVGDKTIWQYVKDKKAVLNQTMLERIKVIAEGVGKHGDVIRVDIFVNTQTGAMVVNEIESYWRVCKYYPYMFHEESVNLMAQLWVEGWKRLEERGTLKRIKRIAARYQDLAPGWSTAGDSSSSAGDRSSICPPPPADGALMGTSMWLVCVVIVGACGCFGGAYFFSGPPKGTSNAGGVELVQS